MADQLDMFWISAIDPSWRDNRDAMGYPFLSLQKRRTQPIEFEQNGVRVSVGADSRFSIATIWDWDVMIFAASHLNEAIESRRKVSPRISFVPHDCLKQLGRPIGGDHYQRLADAIRRLAATLVITNIREADQPELGEERGFHWLTGYRIPKRYPRYRAAPNGVTYITPRDPEGEVDPVRLWEIELHPWLYNAIVRQGDILAVHPDYFLLTGGIERWLYRLARKAVLDKATPPAIRFKMETLRERSGVTGDLRHFAEDIRAIKATQPLPEYSIKVESRRGRSDLVTLYRDLAKPCRPPRGRRLKAIQGHQAAAEQRPEKELPALPGPDLDDIRAALADSPQNVRESLVVGVQDLLQRLINATEGQNRAEVTFPDGNVLSIEPKPAADQPLDLKAFLQRFHDDLQRILDAD